MTDQPKPGTVAWLRENVWLQCRCGGWWRPSELRLHQGVPICVNDMPHDGSRWSDLPPFDPFARLEEAERLLGEVIDGYQKTIDQVDDKFGDRLR